VYSYPNIIWVIKSRRMRWSGHVAYMGEVHTGFSCRYLGERDHLKDLGISGRIILQWTIGLIWLSIGTGSGFL